MEDNTQKEKIQTTDSDFAVNIGNFIVKKVENEDESFVEVRSVSGHWRLVYRHDNEMYGKILAMMLDPEYEDTLRMTIVYMYHATTILIDPEFATDYVNALERMHNRFIAALPEPTEEEEDAAIREIEVLTEIQENLDSQG